MEAWPDGGVARAGPAEGLWTAAPRVAFPVFSLCVLSLILLDKGTACVTLLTMVNSFSLQIQPSRVGTSPCESGWTWQFGLWHVPCSVQEHRYRPLTWAGHVAGWCCVPRLRHSQRLVPGTAFEDGQGACRGPCWAEKRPAGFTALLGAAPTSHSEPP